MISSLVDQLARRLMIVTLVIAVVVIAAGFAAGKPLLLMVETGIALAVATIPEGLPIVATIALARGLWRMSRHNALINRISAVETLGATSVLCTDKTGTLTENRMRVARVVLDDGEVEVEPPGGASEAPFRRGGRGTDPGADALLQRALGPSGSPSSRCYRAVDRGSGGEAPLGVRGRKPPE